MLTDFGLHHTLGKSYVFQKVSSKFVGTLIKMYFTLRKKFVFQGIRDDAHARRSRLVLALAGVRGLPMVLRMGIRSALGERDKSCGCVESGTGLWVSHIVGWWRVHIERCSVPCATCAPVTVAPLYAHTYIHTHTHVCTFVHVLCTST